MVLDMYQIMIMKIVSYVIFFFTFMKLFDFLLHHVISRSKRWRPMKLIQVERVVVESKFLLKLFLLDQTSGQIELRKQLLLGCGIQLNVLFYEFTRRMVCTVCLILIVLSYYAFAYPILLFYFNPIYVGISSIILFIFVWFDKKILEQLKSTRRQKIVKEIYTISNHLLYYTNSSLNLHAKLTRGLGLTSTLRSGMELLLNEWYQDAEHAIKMFKSRINTDEAHSFAETLNVIRLNESENYYELLRQRISDYKEQIELTRDSRKETISYLLFVLAGIPIMNTFRVFLYPWIAEGQKLFNGIN